MIDDLDERLKKTREFFNKVNYAYDFTLADALIDTRARLSVLEAARKAAGDINDADRAWAAGAAQIITAYGLTPETPLSTAEPRPQGGVEDLATMLSEAKSDPPIEGLELFAVMRERDYMREKLLELQAERDRRAQGGESGKHIVVTGEMLNAALNVWDDPPSFVIANRMRAALTAAFALVPKATPAAAPQGWRMVPVEPTREMWAAMGTAALPIGRHHDAVVSDVWKTGLAASPPPPVAAPGLGEKIAQILVELSMGETSVASAQGAIFALLTRPVASERDPAQGSLNSGEGV